MGAVELASHCPDCRQLAGHASTCGEHWYWCVRCSVWRQSCDHPDLWRLAWPPPQGGEKHPHLPDRKKKKRKGGRSGGRSGGGSRRRVRRLGKIYGRRCGNCDTVNELTVDHVMPLSKGGPDSFGNWQILCGPCNVTKGATTVDYRNQQIMAQAVELDEHYRGQES